MGNILRRSVHIKNFFINPEAIMPVIRCVFAPARYVYFVKFWFIVLRKLSQTTTPIKSTMVAIHRVKFL